MKEVVDEHKPYSFIETFERFQTSHSELIERSCGSHRGDRARTRERASARHGCLFELRERQLVKSLMRFPQGEARIFIKREV